MNLSDTIFLLRHSLKHEPELTQCLQVDRATFFRMRAQEKATRYRDFYFERVTAATFHQELRAVERQAAKKAYSMAIQKKYNVGPDWQQNRWFVEQVRPTL